MIRTVGRDMNRHQALSTHRSSLATIYSGSFGLFLLLRILRVIFPKHAL